MFGLLHLDPDDPGSRTQHIFKNKACTFTAARAPSENDMRRLRELGVFKEFELKDLM